MRAEIAQLQTRLGVTTLYVTHDQVEAMTMGDRVAVLKRGVLQQADAPQELYDRPDNLFVAGFIGSPAMNLGRGRLEHRDGRHLVAFGEHELEIPQGALDKYRKVADHQGDVVVGLRPEHFERSSDNGRSMRVKVDLVEALGSDVLVHFGVTAPPIISEDMRQAVDDDDAFEELQRKAAEGGQSFTARLEPKDMPKLGEEIHLAFRGEYLHFFDPDTGLALR
jgi:multiple sugar transport system ATP-binding protein